VWVAGCGGGGDKHAAACSSQPTTHYVTYRARAGATPVKLDATVRALCDRARAEGLNDVAVRRRGALIDIAGPLRPPPRVAFYDWRTNLKRTLADNPALTNADITDPKQEFDSVTNEPIVAFRFTARGARVFARVTRREARRGAQRGRPQTFAIVVDDRVVSRPQIDYRQNPNGLSGSNGAQINGFAGIQEARDFARAMASRPLPLQLVRVGSH
jgi:preprotein translocase subunit SecD